MGKISDVESLRREIAILKEMAQVKWDSHFREHSIEREAVQLAHADMDRRLNEMNRLKEQMAASDAKYIPRPEYDANHKTLEVRVDSLAKLVYIGLGGVMVISGFFSWFFSKH